MKNQRKYVVYLTQYKGTKLPSWYIGSSYEEKVNKGYNGTVLSKKYKEIYRKEQNENKHLFKTRILSYHKTREEALTEELRLQKLHKVVHSNKYFNESYATINGMFGRDVSGELHPMYGKHHSDKSKLLISKNHADVSGENNPIYGIERSEEVKKRISKSNSKIMENGKSVQHNATMKRIEKNGKHWNTFKVLIFDEKDNIRYNDYLANINDDIPIQSLRKSMKLNGKPIYMGKIGSVKEKWRKYQGWYMKKEKDES